MICVPYSVTVSLTGRYFVQFGRQSSGKLHLDDLTATCRRGWGWSPERRQWMNDSWDCPVNGLPLLSPLSLFLSQTVTCKSASVSEIPKCWTGQELLGVFNHLRSFINDVRSLKLHILLPTIVVVVINEYWETELGRFFGLTLLSLSTSSAFCIKIISVQFCLLTILFTSFD